MTNSILLENINKEGLKEIISEAVRKEFGMINGKKEATFLTRAEQAKKLRISLPTLDKLVQIGKVRAYRAGGRILFREDELQLTEIPIRKNR